MRDAQYGIWGGRFQVIHKGHEFVLEYAAKNYKNICIGIVNPNLDCPPCTVKEHEKFAKSENPFTYFQRAYLWDLLLKHHGINAVIVPHWHPRKSLELEATFLPPKGEREWIIPHIHDEIFKIEDFENRREKVFCDFNLPVELTNICASKIRKWFTEKHSDFTCDIPQAILTETENFLNGNKYTGKYIIVPIIGDNIHPSLLCGGIQQAINSGKKIVFAPIVKVKDENEWWKFKPIVDCNILTFYQRYEIINELMKEIGYYGFMVLPIIVRNETCEHLDAFMPAISDRTWLFHDKFNTDPAFNDIIRNEDMIQLDTKNIPNDVFNNVGSLKFDIFKRMKYELRKNLSNRKDDKKTTYGKDDINVQINNNINNINNIQAEQFISGNNNNAANNESSSYVYNEPSSSVENDLKEIIRLIDGSNEESTIKKNIERANTFLKEKEEEEIKKIIADYVKQIIDSKEKKESFQKKIKGYAIDVSKSFFANLLLEALKVLFSGN